MKFVSAATSSVNKKSFPVFPKLKTGEKKVITFINQLKEFDPKNDFANSPAMVDIEFYYDETSKSYFKIDDSVSDELRAKIVSKKSVKSNKRCLANFLIYDTDKKGVITGIEGLYIAKLGSDKLGILNEIEEGLKADNAEATIYDIDLRIKCEDEQYHKWIITPTTKKAFADIDEATQKEWLKEGQDYINNFYDKMNGQVLDEAALCEKFGFYEDEEDEDEDNAMAQSEESDGDFAHIKKPAATKSPFAKK